MRFSKKIIFIIILFVVFMHNVNATYESSNGTAYNGSTGGCGTRENCLNNNNYFIMQARLYYINNKKFTHIGKTYYFVNTSAYNALSGKGMNLIKITAFDGYNSNKASFNNAYNYLNGTYFNNTALTKEFLNKVTNVSNYDDILNKDSESKGGSKGYRIVLEPAENFANPTFSSESAAIMTFKGYVSELNRNDSSVSKTYLGADSKAQWIFNNFSDVGIEVTDRYYCESLDKEQFGDIRKGCGYKIVDINRYITPASCYKQNGIKTANGGLKCTNYDSNNEEKYISNYEETACNDMTESSKLNYLKNYGKLVGGTNACGIYCTEEAEVSFPGNVLNPIQQGSYFAWPSRQDDVTGKYKMSVKSKVVCHTVGTEVSNTSSTFERNCPTGYVDYPDPINGKYYDICRKNDYTDKICPTGTEEIEGQCYEVSNGTVTNAKTTISTALVCQSDYTTIASTGNQACRKQTGTNYYCPSGSSVKSGSGASLKCQKFSHYYCDSGYSLWTGSGGPYCWKYTGGYYCDFGYAKWSNGNTCWRCTVGGGYLAFKCLSGWNSSTYACSSWSSSFTPTNSNQNEIYSCGYYSSGSGTKCPSGYTKSGNYCYRYTYNENASSCALKGGTFINQDSQTTKEGTGKCRFVRSPSSYSANTWVESGWIQGTTHWNWGKGTLRSAYTEVAKASSPIYSYKAKDACPSGYYKSGNTCLKNVDPYCDSGANLTKDKSKCVVCPTGYTFDLESGTCRKPATRVCDTSEHETTCYQNNAGTSGVLVTKKYTDTRVCPIGYENNPGGTGNNACRKQTTTTYSCDSGWTKVTNDSTSYCCSGSNCYTKGHCEGGYSSKTLPSTYCWKYRGNNSAYYHCDSDYAKWDSAGNTCWKCNQTYYEAWQTTSDWEGPWPATNKENGWYCGTWYETSGTTSGCPSGSRPYENKCAYYYTMKTSEWCSEHNGTWYQSSNVTRNGTGTCIVPTNKRSTTSKSWYYVEGGWQRGVEHWEWTYKAPNAIPQYEYSAKTACPSDYPNRDANGCYKELPKSEHYCSTGTYVDKLDTCVICPDGYTVTENGLCRKSYTCVLPKTVQVGDNCYETTNKRNNWSCPANYSLSGTTCVNSCNKSTLVDGVKNLLEDSAGAKLKAGTNNIIDEPLETKTTIETDDDNITFKTTTTFEINDKINRYFNKETGAVANSTSGWNIKYVFDRKQGVVSLGLTDPVTHNGKVINYNLELSNIKFGILDNYGSYITDYKCTYKTTINSCKCPSGTDFAGISVYDLTSNICNLEDIDGSCADLQYKLCNKPDKYYCKNSSNNKIDITSCVTERIRNGKKPYVAFLECRNERSECTDTCNLNCKGDCTETNKTVGNVELNITECNGKICNIAPYCTSDNAIVSSSSLECMAEKLNLKSEKELKNALNDGSINNGQLEEAANQCESTICGKQRIVFRTIDLKNPFYGNIDRNVSGLSLTGNKSRKPGSNWNSVAVVTNNILKARNSTGNALYNKTPLYIITLTPKNIKAIRNYNRNHTYSDFDLNCNDSDSTYGCISSFIHSDSNSLKSMGIDVKGIDKCTNLNMQSSSNSYKECYNTNE